MGKKLDALLGRSFKASKFKALVNLALSRLAVLKNQKQTRCSMARNDVLQFLNIGQHDRALLRVEQVIKEQNMLDVFVMIEGYCVLLSERVKLVEHDKECPDELKEVISSLIFAASRCGEFPELQEMRSILTTRYGKEFAARAIELRNSCGVNTKMIQKLSTRQPSLEARMKALKEIADENGIALKLEDSLSILAQEELHRKENQPAPNRSASLDSPKVGEDMGSYTENIDNIEGFSDSMHRRKHYKDAADAAQEAFMSAAYAARAARAAVELSRSSPRAPDNSNSPTDQRKHVFNSDSDIKPRIETSKVDDSGETAEPVLGLDKAHPVGRLSLNSDDEVTEEKTEVPEVRFSGAQEEKEKKLPHKAMFDESDDEVKNEKFNFLSEDNPWGERGTKSHYSNEKLTPSRFQAGSGIDDGPHFSAEFAVKSAHRMNTLNRPVSVRTRR